MITDRKMLLKEQESIKDRGYSYNDEESIVGLRAVEVLITNQDGVLGAISVSGLTNCMIEILPERNPRAPHESRKRTGTQDSLFLIATIR
jgi:DNA-binding IclR family transcriptional regulator